MAEKHRFVTTSPSDARRRVVEQMEDDCARAVEDTELMVSEVVTNAILHAGEDEVPVSVQRMDDEIEIRVTDSSNAEAQPVESDLSEPGGLGLAIVAQLSTDWGVERHPHDGKDVWFRVSCSDEPTSSGEPTT